MATVPMAPAAMNSGGCFSARMTYAAPTEVGSALINAPTNGPLRARATETATTAVAVSTIFRARPTQNSSSGDIGIVDRQLMFCSAALSGAPLCRREHEPADNFAGLQFVERFVDGGERPRAHREIRSAFAADESKKLGHFVEAADIRALHADGAQRQRRQRHGNVAAEQADDNQFAALDQAIERKLHRARRADEIDHRPGATVGGIDDLFRGVGGPAVDCGLCAGLERGFAPDRVDIDDNRSLAAHRLVQRQAHEPEAAGADDDHRLIKQHRADFLERSKGGDARTGERCSALRRNVADVEQIARVRHQEVVGVAAGTENADAERRAAQLLAAALADFALSAPQPGMHKPAVANLDAGRVRADGDNLADILVPHGQRQLHAAVAEFELLAAAQVVIAVPNMQVAVADAGRDHLEQDLTSRRLRGRPFHQPQRRAALTNVVAFHRTFLLPVWQPLFRFVNANVAYRRPAALPPAASGAGG